MTDPFDRDAWESWEVRFDDRPTNPAPRRSFWEDVVIDLTAEEADLIPDSPDTFLDLADDVVDLVDDVEDRTA
jgi:hypothetical protein